MRQFKRFLLLMVFVLPLGAIAQEGMQDAIYLKDGSIYRGIIIEQVPNVSYKIKSRDGNVYAVKVGDVEKITKEKMEHPPHPSYGPWGHWNHMPKDTMMYDPNRRGYFNELQVLVENVQGGVRFVNGYKFGRYGYLGVGVGVDRVFSNPFNPKVNGLARKALAGVYMPLYLYHAGDGPMKGRISPFYAVEAGYAMAFKGWGNKNLNVDDYGNRLQGGVIAGMGLGFKVHSRRHRGHFSLLFNVNYKQVKYETDNIILDNNGQITGVVTQHKVGHLIIPGIRLGIGF
ncbi:MAG: hypothetical protein GC178_09545 [Flavobacteriales bacterium]|nr:hypothetical protein [Flavobacteriales bacterium]